MRKWLKLIGIDPAPYASRVMSDSVGNWLPKGIEVLRVGEEDIEYVEYVKEERGI